MRGERRRLAITLVEVLISLSIVLILAALTLPVVVSAKAKAGETNCVTQLRQIYIATALYQADWGSELLGRTYEMGLPPTPSALSIPSGFRSCSGRNPTSCLPGGLQRWYPPPPAPILAMTVEEVEELQQEWLGHLRRYGERTVFYSDQGHQFACPVTGLAVQRALGIDLGGGLRWRRWRGNPNEQEWWHEANNAEAML